MRTIEIKENDSGIRLDKFLSKALKTMPKSLMYKYIRTKKIKLNSKRAAQTDVLSTGDIITLYISEEFFDKPVSNESFLRLKANLSVIYEDENIIIVDKPSGLIVHSDENEEYNTLINHIKKYLFDKGEYLPENENSFAPALCNRIDRNTQGLVIAAKNALALRILNEKIKLRELEKSYLCAVHGKPHASSGVLKGYITKNQATNTVSFSETKLNPSSKEAITSYRVITENKQEQLSLLEIELITGRTHQIRASLAYIGCPLLGDGKYAQNKEDRKKGWSSQALCAYRLKFLKTAKKTGLDYLNGMEFTANEPYFLKLFGY